MKKKLIRLAVAILLSLSLTGCSFLSDLAGGGSGGSGGSGSSVEPEKKLDSLSPQEGTITRNYYVGDEFIKPTMIATYKDGTSEIVTDKCTYTGYDMSVAGDYKVTIAYLNHTFSYTIHVKEKGATVTDLDFESSPQINYYQGDEFIKPTMIATFADGTSKDVTEECTFTGYDMSVIGDYTVKVTYQKFYITYTIYVKEKYAKEQRGYHLSDYEKTVVVDEPYRFYYFDSDGKEYDNETIKVADATYSVDDDSILSIDKYGQIKGLKAGSTYIYLASHFSDGSDYFNFRCLVTVEEKHITKLEVNNYRNKFYTGKTFNFLCTAIATYQTGYQEEVTPTIDSSKVNMNAVGEYDVVISYTINGTTQSVTKKINVLDSSTYVIEKSPLAYNISDYLNNHFGITAMPNKGSIKMLVIPVKFTDSDNCITNYANVKEDINTTFFGTSEEVGWRSVKTFYEEESKNIVSITGKTSNWYESGLASTDCYTESNIVTLKQNAVEWFFTNNPGEDRTSYDSDHDGYIDGLCLIYGSPDYRTGKLEGSGAANLWAMVKTRGDQKKDVNKPIADKYLWASYDSIYPTKTKALERTGKSEYTEHGMYNSSLSYLGFDTRTYIHEVGHMFGLNDYYSSTEGTVFYAGHTNVQTLNMLSHDPYSLLLYGWAEPYIPDATQTITIKDFQDDHEVIMLKPTVEMTNSPFDEYILIDLYAPTGLNKYNAVDHPLVYGETTKDDLNVAGVRIWHVDARLLNSSGEFTTNPNTYGGVVMGASNSYDVEDTSICKEFVELELVRNNVEAELRTLTYNKASDYFYSGDTFDMATFYKQFANGTKLDSGLDLGWTIKIDGIYKTTDGYSADITVTKL